MRSIFIIAMLCMVSPSSSTNPSDVGLSEAVVVDVTPPAWLHEMWVDAAADYLVYDGTNMHAI